MQHHSQKEHLCKLLMLECNLMNGLGISSYTVWVGTSIVFLGSSIVLVGTGKDFVQSWRTVSLADHFEPAQNKRGGPRYFSQTSCCLGRNFMLVLET